MAIKISVAGMESFIAQLENIQHSTDRVIGKAIYAGAGKTVEAVRRAVNALPEISDTAKKTAWGQRSPTPGVTREQKQGLLNGLGIAEIEEKNGVRNVKIGFEGYNRLRTAAFPQGQPNALVARGLESGSSAQQKHPFVRPAVNGVRQKAQAAMQEAADAELQKILKEQESE